MAKESGVFLTTALIISQAFLTVLQAGQAPPSPTPGPVAQVRQRIERDRLEIRVYQGKKLVPVAPFIELCVVKPLAGSPETMENLARRSVAIVRSEKQPERWEVYQDVWAGAGRELTLADNVFMVKQVLISSPRNPIELRLDEKVVTIEPGEAILVL